MTKSRLPTRMVKASSLRDWLLWLAEHYDPALDAPENVEFRRLGEVLEELGRMAGAIDTSGKPFGRGSLLLESFDWDEDEIEFNRYHLLLVRMGSPDPEHLIGRLVAVTGIPERGDEAPVEPEYAL
jgi:Ser/Thr protein kinase RdoA (MazF antagonist)